MQFRRSAIILGLLVAVSGPPATPAQVDVPVWAATFLQSWYSAYNDGDAARLEALYSSSAFLTINNGHDGGSAAIGGPSIGASLAKESKKARRTCQGNYDGVQELGGLGVAWGQDKCLQRSGDSDAVVELHRRWLRVLVPTRSGQWVASQESIEDIDAAKK